MPRGSAALPCDSLTIFHPGISAFLVMVQVDQASCFRLLERG